MQRSTETAAPAIRLIGLYRCRAMYRITNNHNNWRFGIAVRVWVRVQPQFAASTVVDNSYDCRLLVNVQTGAPSCVRGPFVAATVIVRQVFVVYGSVRIWLFPRLNPYEPAVEIMMRSAR